MDNSSFFFDKIEKLFKFYLKKIRVSCENTDICCSHHILPRGHRPERLSAWKNNVQCPPSSEQSLDRQDLHQRPF